MTPNLETQGNYKGTGELCTFPSCLHPDTVHGDTTTRCMECGDDHAFTLEEQKPPYEPANTGDRVIRISFTGEVTAVLPVVEGKTEEEVIELMSWAIPDEAWMSSLQESEIEIGTLDEHNWVVPDPEEDTDGS